MANDLLQRRNLITLAGLSLALIVVYSLSKILGMRAAFWALSMGMSIFYGAYAANLFTKGSENWPLSQHIHQAWFNFVCSFSGWLVVSYLGFMRQTNEAMHEYVLIVYALVSITGYLPSILIGSFEFFIALAAKAINKISG